MSVKTIEAKYDSLLDRLVWFTNVQLHNLLQDSQRKSTSKTKIRHHIEFAGTMVRTLMEHDCTAGSIQSSLGDMYGYTLEIFRRFERSSDRDTHPKSRVRREAVEGIIRQWVKDNTES